MQKQISFHKVEVYPKKWGEELWIINFGKYCGKILRFTKRFAKFSMHFHAEKEETWFVSRGVFELRWTDTNDAKTYSKKLSVGDVIHIPPFMPHQLINLRDVSEIFEISTEHKEEDSYRILPGDSQK